MAEYISPGVFTNEIDSSFLPGAIAGIGGAVIGPTIKGPAQVPTKVTSFSEFEEIFGTYTPDSYVPFVVQEYLKYADVMTVTRLLYEDGYELTDGALAIVAESASVKYVTHLLHPTITAGGTGSMFEKSILSDDESGSFAIKISGSYDPDTTIPGFSGTGDYVTTGFISASIKDVSNNVTKVFGSTPKSLQYPVYTQYENDSATSLFDNLGDVSMSLAIINDYEFLNDFKPASTPWVTSQKVGIYTTNLFYFSTLSHGNVENYDVKIGIRDIRLPSEIPDPNGFGTFTVEVRRVNNSNLPNSPFNSDDTDKDPIIVETYSNCNLDKNSPNYICKKIGDRERTIDSEGRITDTGGYSNNSDYIRVTVSDIVSIGGYAIQSLIPFGFTAPNSTIPDVSGSTGNLNLQAVSYQDTQVIGSLYNSRNYFGFDYTNKNNLQYLGPLPTSGSNTGSNTNFYLGDVSQDAQAVYPSSAPYTASLQGALTGGTFASNIKLGTRKFMVPFQGGFDGTRPNLPKLSGGNITATNTFGFDCSTATTSGTSAYKQAFAALSNADYFDINMLVTPGILYSLHPTVVNSAIVMAEDRQDTFYVMDIPQKSDNISTTITTANGIDSNYTATYYPWVSVNDPNLNTMIDVPPSVVIPGALAYNDFISAPWYAPAGLNRGGLSSVLDTQEKLTQSDRDDLYFARINPIANFPNEGIVIWGQKTLQSVPSALDRVNVRRLLITVKKYIASATKYLVFDQNSSNTRNKFLNIVNPYLESVRQNQGLSAFKVVMDESNNTPDVIDQNRMVGELFLQPTRTAEFIILDFHIQPTGAAFPE